MFFMFNFNIFVHALTVLDQTYLCECRTEGTKVENFKKYLLN